MAKRTGKPFNISKASSRQIARLDYTQIAKMLQPQMVELVNRAANLASKRLSTIEKKGMLGMAYAFNRYLNEEMPSKADPKARKQSLVHEFVKLQEFLGSKTSSYKGIEKVMAKEEERLFKGGPGFQTPEERTRFWSAYMEAMGDERMAKYYNESTRVQQMLARMTFWRDRSFTADDISNLVDSMKGKKSTRTGARDWYND